MISIARAGRCLITREEITEIRNNFERIIGSEVSEEFVNEQLENPKRQIIRPCR